VGFSLSLSLSLSFCLLNCSGRSDIRYRGLLGRLVLFTIGAAEELRGPEKHAYDTLN
jgi:hypothetical protein